MKGFRTEFKAGFTKGLRDESTRPRNSGLLTECLNARVMAGGGLEGYIPSINAFPAITGVTSTFDWPFPQLFHSDDAMYVGNAVSLYQLSVAGGVWAGTNLAAAFTHGITWPWTFAKFPLFPVFTCGDLLVYYDYAATAWKFWQFGDAHASQGSKWNSAWYQPVSICNFNGQAICAGAKTATTAPSQSRLVRWSEIGSFDFLGQTATTRKNEAGEWYLPYDDKEIVMRVLPLETGVVVYGSLGIWAMFPVASPSATWGFKRIWDYGIANPLAAGGHHKRHLAVDRRGELLSIGEDFNVQRLGYSEFFSAIQTSVSIATSSDIISVQHNPWEDEWYIGSDEKQYIYREGGMTDAAKAWKWREGALTETIRRITSMVNLQHAAITDASARSTITGGAYGFYSDLAPTDAAYMKFVTDSIDFGYNGLKTIEYVELVGDFPSATALQVAIDYRYDKSATSYSRSTWIRCNPEAVAVPIVTAADMRVCVKVTPYTNVKVYGINVGWKAVDKRHIRGVYNAYSPNAGAGS